MGECFLPRRTKKNILTVLQQATHFKTQGSSSGTTQLRKFDLSDAELDKTYYAFCIYGGTFRVYKYVRTSETTAMLELIINPPGNKTNSAAIAIDGTSLYAVYTSDDYGSLKKNGSSGTISVWSFVESDLRMEKAFRSIGYNYRNGYRSTSSTSWVGMAHADVDEEPYSFLIGAHDNQFSMYIQKNGLIEPLMMTGGILIEKESDEYGSYYLQDMAGKYFFAAGSILAFLWDI